ncbi:hypothetical protein QE197_08705 [Arsenophonus nasoniae]|uniref:Uncharacterized protein n=1 Tax=Arsenophonus nasoniae TaxID=638 RepID=A0A4P7KTN5_9GAMM|nr:hypothetical protein [Arsenophonus nasoniae]QBY43509.1 hypothetical protein ArsFIN_20760 [Arsenophonus nasoniae]WGM07478.1 hypothetical protein QE258_09690 [Arsenophonus nasoniae]WGM12334.1 hypothetical protein QE197_08705 [Arsenophonus nasoniae]WGM17014.1 hypothetical protein QE193_08590 [Arsenophonus nasoniae]
MDERIEVLESRIGKLEKQFTEMNKVNYCTKSEHSVNAILQNALDLTHVKKATSNFKTNFKTNCKVTYQQAVIDKVLVKDNFILEAIINQPSLRLVTLG